MNTVLHLETTFILQVKDIYLHPDPFSIQNGLLTPSLKMKRPQLKDYFKPQIEDLYRHLDWSDWASILILFSLASDTKTRRRIEACLRRIYKEIIRIFIIPRYFYYIIFFMITYIATQERIKRKHRLDY